MVLVLVCPAWVEGRANHQCLRCYFYDFSPCRPTRANRCGLPPQPARVRPQPRTMALSDTVPHTPVDAEQDTRSSASTASNGLSTSSRERRRIAVYGGAFDPPTTAHLQCAAQIVHSGMADEVMIVPCGPRPDKPNLKTSAMDRYVMCQIAVNTTFSTEFPVSVCDAEVGCDKALATYDLLTALRESNPDCDLVFVVGSDWLQPSRGSDIRNWRSNDGPTGKRLVDEFDFLVIKRPNYDVDDLSMFSPRFQWLVMPDGMQYIDSNLSSTEIRTRCLGRSQFENRLHSIDGLVAPGVLAFVNRRGLYNGDTPVRSIYSRSALPLRSPRSTRGMSAGELPDSAKVASQ